MPVLLLLAHDHDFQLTSRGLPLRLSGVIATTAGRLGIEHWKLDLGGELCIHQIVLTFAPFAASARMIAAARNNPPFAVRERGVAVALLQAGLMQQNIPMPRTMKKGSPDGDYGSETVAAVTTFQRNNKLAKVDGIAGKDTIMLLDKLLAKAASNNDGRLLTINVEGMVRDVSSAKARFQREVAQM